MQCYRRLVSFSLNLTIQIVSGGLKDHPERESLETEEAASMLPEK